MIQYFRQTLRKSVKVKLGTLEFLSTSTELKFLVTKWGSQYYLLSNIIIRWDFLATTDICIMNDNLNFFNYFLIHKFWNIKILFLNCSLFRCIQLYIFLWKIKEAKTKKNFNGSGESWAVKNKQKRRKNSFRYHLLCFFLRKQQRLRIQEYTSTHLF